MRCLFFLLVVMYGSEAARAASSEPSLLFSVYAKQLKESDSIIFVSSCKMANGGRAIMIFRQADQDGKYFELRGDRTVRYEQIVLQNGGFEIKTNSETRYLGKEDEAIKTLIRSYPYFMMPSYEFDSVLRVAPNGKCFEKNQ
jgi:hypothetical protein